MMSFMTNSIQLPLFSALLIFIMHGASEMTEWYREKIRLGNGRYSTNVRDGENFSDTEEWMTILLTSNQPSSKNQSSRWCMCGLSWWW